MFFRVCDFQFSSDFRSYSHLQCFVMRFLILQDMWKLSPSLLAILLLFYPFSSSRFLPFFVFQNIVLAPPLCSNYSFMFCLILSWLLSSFPIFLLVPNLCVSHPEVYPCLLIVSLPYCICLQICLACLVTSGVMVLWSISVLPLGRTVPVTTMLMFLLRFAIVCYLSLNFVWMCLFSRVDIPINFVRDTGCNSLFCRNSSMISHFC